MSPTPIPSSAAPAQVRRHRQQSQGLALDAGLSQEERQQLEAQLARRLSSALGLPELAAPHQGAGPKGGSPSGSTAPLVSVQG